jgi:hypothetical protein
MRKLVKKNFIGSLLTAHCHDIGKALPKAMKTGRNTV